MVKFHFHFPTPKQSHDKTKCVLNLTTLYKLPSASFIQTGYKNPIQYHSGKQRPLALHIWH